MSLQWQQKTIHLVNHIFTVSINTFSGGIKPVYPLVVWIQTPFLQWCMGRSILYIRDTVDQEFKLTIQKGPDFSVMSFIWHAHQFKAKSTMFVCFCNFHLSLLENSKHLSTTHLTASVKRRQWCLVTEPPAEEQSEMFQLQNDEVTNYLLVASVCPYSWFFSLSLSPWVTLLGSVLGPFHFNLYILT